ncbi:hypothetical protein GCM10011613_00340 [Cellvibrio zantedeschiae]|uniref:Uncharacterized protein n=1 Tax=Cellvibrio zantedeschiae TaxID=1237077 RepID=A0ABQ3AQR9_9GAMM|nr:hypothetical protein GCM10011613_00340 [Cellvibrio zantedeschiae]
MKLDAFAEDAEDDSAELLDDTAALLDDELEDELVDEELTSEELDTLLDDKLEELGVFVGAELLPPEPPPQAASNKNDKYKIALINFMANTCCCYEYRD